VLGFFVFQRYKSFPHVRPITSVMACLSRLYVEPLIGDTSASPAPAFQTIDQATSVRSTAIQNPLESCKRQSPQSKL
jgi:hypothetical protein